MILCRVSFLNSASIGLACLFAIGCTKATNQGDSDVNTNASSAAAVAARGAEKKKIKPEDNFIAVLADKITGKTWLKDFDAKIEKIPPSSTYLSPDGKIRNSADASKFCPLFKGDKIYLTDERPSNYKDNHIYLKIDHIERGAKGIKYLEEVRTTAADLKPVPDTTTTMQNTAPKPSVPAQVQDNVPVTSMEVSGTESAKEAEKATPLATNTELISFECKNKSGWLYVPHLQESDISKLSEGECCTFPLKFVPGEFCEGDPVKGFGAGRTSGDGTFRQHAACDLYGDVGAGIYAVDDGKVIDYYDFYLGTNALVVQHPTFLVRYGEVSGTVSGIGVDSIVKKGQKIAFIGRLEGLSYSMLHFEMYSGNASGSLSNDALPFKRRSDLVNPIPHIKKWLKNLPN